MHQPTARTAPGETRPAEPPAGSSDQARGQRRAPIIRLIDWIVTGLLVAGILLTGFIAYGLLDNRWYKVVAVVGGSMSPTIEQGDLIVLTRPPETIRTGMVLTLEVDERVVTHRVVGFRPDGSFVTRGDANTVRDDFRGLHVRVIGEYRFSIPWLANLFRIGRTSGPVSGAYFADQIAVDGTASTAETFPDDEPLLLESPPGVTRALPEPPPADATPDPTAAPTPEPPPASPPL